MSELLVRACVASILVMLEAFVSEPVEPPSAIGKEEKTGGDMRYGRYISTFNLGEIVLPSKLLGR